MMKHLHRSAPLTITTILLTGSVQPFAAPTTTRRAFATKGIATKFATSPSLASTDAADAGASPPTSTSKPSSITTKTKIIAQDHEFIKSDPDKRSYRAITLPNQLTALLVSDPTTDTEAASVHVRAGHFDDPPHRAGLAHFHEHMLFLGTEKYPKEEEYEEFLGSNGGMSNAYTDMEDTNYYFNVAPLDHGDKVEEGSVSSALLGALDRFAQFFISPLFDETMLERELRAVDSEYLNGRTSDNWRNFQILKQGSNKDHPMNKFGCGNYNTLTDGGVLKAQGDDEVESTNTSFGGGTSPRQDLISFWTDKYHAGNLRLCVFGRASLDDLQKTVEIAFGPVRPSPPGFIANSIIDQVKAGLLKTADDVGSHLFRDDKGDFVFQTEHLTYAPNVAFGSSELGMIREVVPLIESRTLKIFSSVPPLDDPVLRESRPFRVLSHLVGHESPGSLHHLLMEEGWINSLSSGTGISSSDFCLINISIVLTPKGMRERDQVLSKTWQWLALIKNAVMNDEHGLIEQYHNELKRISDISFKFREMGDPTDFCSAAAEKLFDYEPPKLLMGGGETGDYDAEVARAFLQRITPQNSLVVVTGPEHEEFVEGCKASAQGSSWEVEERYGGKYRQKRISNELAEAWTCPIGLDSRLRLPALNEFIPGDLSLRCEDPEALASFDPNIDYRKQPPKLMVNTPKLRMWHKLDRTFRVPKASIRLSLTSPDVYRTPRTMTLNRIFQAVLREDLNSFVYDAAIAGCNYGISCVPGSFRLSVSGYSEKLPRLLDVVTSRIESLISEMKEGEQAHPALARQFSKAQENLLRRTKNYVYDSPYETGSYNLKMLLETPVWHVTDYIQELEGPDADADPLTLKECAAVAEACLFGRSKANALCIGNIDENESRQVAELIEHHFLKRRPLAEDETPRFRSLILPTKQEADRIFDSEVNAKVPLIYEAVAHSESEENNSVEIMLQTASNLELGYEGLAIQELISSIAYNSAFNQLRTKEQLGYIVSAFAKKLAGGGNAFCVVVQSSSTLPSAIEESCFAWVEQFRRELEEMTDERLLMETNAVRASLLEKDIKLSEEISGVWNEILSTIPHSHHFKDPVFDRLERFARILTINESSDEADSSSIGTAAELKQKILNFYDRYFMPSSPDRRVVSSRVYNHKSKDAFEENLGKAGYLSSYDDARRLKQQLSTFPTAPYWQ